MYMKAVVLAVVALVMSGVSGRGDALVDELLAQLAPIQTVSCEIRKDNEVGENKVRMLSRVYYEKPNRLHVENFSPLKRRIIADGANFYSYIEGDKKGFSRAVGDLNEEMALQLRKIPGSSMEHLLRLEGVEGQELPATSDYPVRRLYRRDALYVVLALDAQGRLARLDFYRDEALTDPAGHYEYSAFKEVLPGAWIPMMHKGFLKMDDVENHETVRVTNYIVNEPISPTLFDNTLFLKDVEYEDSFEKMYE
ncbi:MAG: hypothetical protein EOM20_03810 [Spartobacteria bacterium]|nr:hypothetical protein [Spartobacteria bacterium]